MPLCGVAIVHCFSFGRGGSYFASKGYFKPIEEKFLAQTGQAKGGRNGLGQGAKNKKDNSKFGNVRTERQLS